MIRALLLAVVGSAVAWPEVIPNCGVVGNWSDEAMTLGVAVRNLSQSVFPHMFSVSEVMLNTCFSGIGTARDHRLMFFYVSNKSDKKQKMYTVVACYGNELWGMAVPLSQGAIPATRIFTLNKVPPAPLPPRLNDTD